MAEGEEGEKTMIFVRPETPSGERNRPVSFFGEKRELQAATLKVGVVEGSTLARKEKAEKKKVPKVSILMK